jgi:succinate dehydrogenase hydrophobic anchor subunit
MTAGNDPTPRNDPPPTRNPVKLARRLASGGVALAKLEAQRGRQEVTEQILQYRTGVILLALAFGFVLLSVFVLMILLVLVISALTGVPGWAVALVILLVLVAFAALFAWRGINKIQATHFTPEETIAAVKEDLEWAKRLLRRG